MATLDARRTYEDGAILFASDLDAIIDDIETFLNSTKLNDDNLQDQGITGSTKLIDLSIPAGKIASNAITTPKIINDAVTTAKILDANVTTAKIADLNVTRAKIEVVERIPTAAMMPFAGSTAPSGWLMADGSAVSRDTYAALYAIIGTTYGVGNGATTFNLPGTPGRAVIGAGAGSGLTTRALGATGGAETHVLTESEMPVHTHTQNAHSHTTSAKINVNVTGGSASFKAHADAGGDSTYTTSGTTATNNNTGGGAAHNNMQPFLAVNYIIKY